jgi:hypothetical protein
MIHPITFSFPEEKIIDKMPAKVKVLSSLIPGDMKTYIYNTEAEYYDEYRKSMFAITTKKAGWDCMRHYEIIANGCIPYFVNIEDCPSTTMALLPKDLIREGNGLYLSLKDKAISEFSLSDMDACASLVERLLFYIRSNLTTTAIARYILKESNHSNAKRILYLSGDTGPDYLRCVTLHGFKILTGVQCQDYPMVPHIYKSTRINYSRLYGKGITYTNMLEPSLHDYEADKTVKEDILNRVYDVIIYGSYHRGMPFYDIVQKVYDPKDVVLLCGEDIHRCNAMEFVRKGHHTFVREL